MEEGQVRADGESAERYIARLEATLRKYSKLNRMLEADLATVKAQCKIHFDNCQELLRHELKIVGTADKRVTLGTVAGTNAKFALVPAEGTPEHYKKEVDEFFNNGKHYCVPVVPNDYTTMMPDPAIRNNDYSYV